MKLLLEKNIVFVEGDLNFKLMLDDEFSPEMKKDDNEQSYILNVCVKKGTKIKDSVIVRNIKDTLAEYFLNQNECKKALYVPREHTISIGECGSEYVDVFYSLEYAHPVLDDGYECEDEYSEVGKNLMSIHVDDSTETTNVIKIEFKSLFLVDELYHMQTLWEIDNGSVHDFLLGEVSRVMQEIEE